MSALYRIEFTLMGLPRTLNSRGHWRVGYMAAKKWQRDVALVVGKRLPPAPLRRAALVLTRFSSAPMDHDNLVSGFKPIVDALVRVGILENDKWDNIGMPAYGWAKAKQKEGRVSVVVEEIRDAE